MISAKIIAHSVNPYGGEIATMELVYPRFIHSEFMTHRVFSRNASSSRAIPIERMIRDIEENPAYPIHWGKNQPGMQAGEEVSNPEDALEVWEYAREQAIHAAEELCALGVHKQVANRLLEPFQHIRVLVTSTEWQNFFNLRDHPDAQPEIQALAKAMKIALEESEPHRLRWGDWHIPYITDNELGLPTSEQLKISVARCARVSYKTTDGQPSTVEKDVALYERLVGSVPLHASPAEHQAEAITAACSNRLVSNLQGDWLQYRKLIEHGIVR